MIIGLMVMRWDERIGADVLACYPEEFEIPNESLMQIYSTHEYNQGESGLISLLAGERFLVSYYSGTEDAVYTIIAISGEENPDVYEEGLADLNRNVIPYIQDSTALKNVLPNLFQRLSIYPTLSYEQRLLTILEDPVKRTILKRLHEDGVVIKSELTIWLREKITDRVLDFEGVIASFYKSNLVKGITINNIDYLFMMEDILVHRRPPVRVLKNTSEAGLPESLLPQYKQELLVFFKEYVPSDEDTQEVIKALLDPQVYEVFKLLRTNVVTRESLEKLRKKGVEDLDGTVKKMWQSHLICVLHDDKSNEYFALVSDVMIKTVFPEHIFNALIRAYEFKEKQKEIIIEYMKELENHYPKYNARQKELAKQIEEEYS